MAHEGFGEPQIEKAEKGSPMQSIGRSGPIKAKTRRSSNGKCFVGRLYRESEFNSADFDVPQVPIGFG